MGEAILERTLKLLGNVQAPNSVIEYLSCLQVHFPRSFWVIGYARSDLGIAMLLAEKVMILFLPLRRSTWRSGGKLLDLDPLDLGGGRNPETAGWLPR